MENFNTWLRYLQPKVIEAFWPDIHMKSTGNCNTDYGGHFCHLNFPADSTQIIPGIVTSTSDRIQAWMNSESHINNGQPTLHDGSSSFGLVLDKANLCTDPLAHAQKMTPMQLQLLEELRKALVTCRRELDDMNSRCLRLNVIKGAETIGHTDSFRSSLLPSYFFFFPPKKNDNWSQIDLHFCLRVRLWRTFKTSFVLFQNQICIPFHYEACPEHHNEFKYSQDCETGGHLKLIKFCDITKKAKWLIVAPHNIEILIPFRKMKHGTAVAGISNGKLKIVNENYRVITKWQDVDDQCFCEVLKDAAVPDTMPRQQFRNLQKPFYLYKFRGWETIHYVEKGSDVKAIRMHIFFRNIRPVSVCAQASIKRVKTGTIEVLKDNNST